jgi:hypothetical protein
MRARLGRSALVVTLIAMVVVVSSDLASAAPPTLTNPPERLYTLINTGIAFAGQDPISGDDRELVITTNDDNCDPLADNDDEPGPDYFLQGCARVQLSVGHGDLAIPLSTTLGFPLPDGLHSGGAVVESSQNGDGTGLTVNLNGTQDQLNDALADLTYTPDNDYQYNGSNPETLEIDVINGDQADPGTLTYWVEIRVEQENDGPTLTVPAGPYDVAPSSATPIPAVMPGVNDLGEFYVEDPDIEDVGLEDEMLLVMVATCGQFELRGGSLTLYNDIAEAMVDYLDIPQAEADTLTALIPATITGAPFATGNPGDPHVALAGIGSFDEINYALSYVTYLAEGTAGSCDLWTVITDLGNNGLPFQYVGSPIGGRDDPQPGFEIPDLGLDFDSTTFIVDGGVEVNVPATLSIPEGTVGQIPVFVSESDHPEFDLSVTATGISATGGGTDYDEPSTPLNYPLNDGGPIDIDLSTVTDGTPEVDETLEVVIDLVGLPAGVTVGNDTTLVTIEDADDETTTTESTTTTTADTTSTTDGSTTTTDGSTTTTESTTTTTDGSTTTTESTTTTTDSTTTTESTTTTTDSTTTTESTTTTTDDTTTTTDGSTTTTDGATTTTDGATTTTDGATTTTDPEVSATTDPEGSTTTADPDDPTTTTTVAVGGAGATSTTAPAAVSPTADALGTGASLTPTGSDPGRLLVTGLGLLLLGAGLVFLASRQRAHAVSRR